MNTKLAPRELPDDKFVWWVEVCLAFDCFINALLRGWHHETLSARAWRAWVNGKVFGRIFRPSIDMLFLWQHRLGGHCRYHYEAEVARAAEIIKARTT